MGKSSSGVYNIVNLVNGKVYVGSSCNLDRREADHFRMLRGNYHGNTYLQNSWNKYGEENFLFLVVEECTVEECVIKEQYWIDKLVSYKFKNGYNRSPTAGSPLGVKHSKKTREKMSKRMLGVPMPSWVKNKIRESLTGHVKSAKHRANLWKNRQDWRHSKESRVKISESLKIAAAEGRRSGPPVGWKHSEESKNKMSVAGRGVPKSEEHRKKIAAALRGKKKSVEHCLAISIAKRSRI